MTDQPIPLHRNDPARAHFEFVAETFPLVVETADEPGRLWLSMRRVGNQLDPLAEFTINDEGALIGEPEVLTQQFRSARVLGWVRDAVGDFPRWKPPEQPARTKTFPGEESPRPQ
jgi:hypothetical protein